MRVYIAAAPAALTAPALEADVVYGVTPALTAVFPDDSEEELEAVAALCAAEYSLTLLGDGPARRLVVAADVEAAFLTEPTEREDLYAGALLLSTPVPWENAVSIHVDDSTAEAAVRAALAGQDPDEALAAHDLLWYDISERSRLASALGIQ